MITCSVCEDPALEKCVATCERCGRPACTDCYWYDTAGKRACETCLSPKESAEIRARDEQLLRAAVAARKGDK